MNVHDSLYSYNLYLAGHAPALMETQIMNETYGDRCCGSCRESSTGKKNNWTGESDELVSIVSPPRRIQNTRAIWIV